ncbi:hypothetical protein EVJ58_g8962 [Rhodofomes roseus]|uniref:Uncharacterized protein n=1 Tax=Rhodofomes roseus TaxID=34475 RepID=A0A4Y9XXW8_9APHY|nr:hypothetical protein EVJ58_g8962 [Rhodofomes roseus]
MPWDKKDGLPHYVKTDDEEEIKKQSGIERKPGNEETAETEEPEMEKSEAEKLKIKQRRWFAKRSNKPIIHEPAVCPADTVGHVESENDTSDGESSGFEQKKSRKPAAKRRRPRRKAVNRKAPVESTGSSKRPCKRRKVEP